MKILTIENGCLVFNLKKFKNIEVIYVTNKRLYNKLDYQSLLSILYDKIEEYYGNKVQGLSIKSYVKQFMQYDELEEVAFICKNNVFMGFEDEFIEFLVKTFQTFDKYNNKPKRTYLYEHHIKLYKMFCEVYAKHINDGVVFTPYRLIDIIKLTKNKINKEFSDLSDYLKLHCNNVSLTEFLQFKSNRMNNDLLESIYHYKIQSNLVNDNQYLTAHFLECVDGLELKKLNEKFEQIADLFRLIITSTYGFIVNEDYGVVESDVRLNNFKISEFIANMLVSELPYINYEIVKETDILNFELKINLSISEFKKMFNI